MRLPRELAILYEDQAAVALDEPDRTAGRSHSRRSHPLGPLPPRRGPQAEKAGPMLCGPPRFGSLYLRHSSLSPKLEADREALIRQFLAHTPLREYVAVVRGHLAAKAGTLVHYFRREGQFQKLSTEREPQSGARRASLLRRTLAARRVARTSIIAISNSAPQNFDHPCHAFRARDS